MGHIKTRLWYGKYEAVGGEAAGTVYGGTYDRSIYRACDAADLS